MIALLGLLIACQTLNAQDFKHVFKTYGIDDGLPSSQIFKVVQDNEGYIWFGTNRGLVKYNGYEFKRYTVKDGLSVNLIFHVHVDEENTVYFVGKDYKIFYIKEDQVYEFEGNAEITDIESRAQILSLITHNNELHLSLWNSIGKPSYFKFEKNGRLLERKTIDFGAEIIDVGETAIIHCGGYFYNDTLEAFNLTYNEIDTTIYSNLLGNNLAYLAKKKDKLYFSIKNFLCSVEKGELNQLKTFGNTIFNLAIDKNDDLYIAFHNQGLIKYPAGELSQPIQVLKDQSSIAILFDSNNNLWCSSNQSGLQFSSLKDYKHIKFKEKVKSLDLIGDENELFAIVDRAEVFRLTSSKMEKQTIHKKTLVSTMGKEHLHRFFMNKDGNSVFNFESGSFDQYNFAGGYYCLDHEVLNDTALFILNRNGFFRYHHQIQNRKSYIVSSRLQCFEYLHDNVFLVGTANGLVVADLEKNTILHENGRNYFRCKLDVDDYHIDHPFFKSSISDIVVDGNVRVYTSVELGLWVEKDTMSKWLTEEDGLVSDNLEKVIYQDGYIIASSNSGISVIDEAFNVRNYNTLNGLITNEVDGFYLRNDSLWVASKLGVSLLDLKSENHHKNDVIPLVLKKVKVNDRPRRIKPFLLLRHIHGRVEVEYEALNYRADGVINYKHKLQGLEENWNYTTNRNIRYTNLPAGKYKLLISHELEGKKWAEPVVLLAFKKRIPIMTHWAFIIFYIFLLFWLFRKTSYFLDRRQRKRQQDALTILELERKALQAQMNPHFMFNSLSSLKYMIMKDKKRDSEDYLTKFAKFTRLTLNHSTEKYVSIEDEMELLQNYIDLELTRFENSFGYNFENNVSKPNLKIPPMIIQPFIENAIIHGFEGLDRLGEITIVFEDNSINTILCTITDNGVGRQAANKNRRHKKSFGMSLVLKRLKLLHKEGDISILDLKEGDKAIGTKVELKIPFVN